MDDQEAQEQMLKVTDYQRNANQNYNEVSPHTGQNGNLKNSQIINAGESMEKREPSYIVGRNVIWCNHYRGSLKN